MILHVELEIWTTSYFKNIDPNVTTRFYGEHDFGTSSDFSTCRRSAYKTMNQGSTQQDEHRKDSLHFLLEIIFAAGFLPKVEVLQNHVPKDASKLEMRELDSVWVVSLLRGDGLKISNHLNSPLIDIMAV